ncbi:peptide deformylase [Pedobacter nanyangensis]|uniref:peptide deformylase n=1 Tax=Pedobacter nanyangensis TaxID=1562389 RepID=UPI000DE220F0|nr:peptide deformylase [Pedobacter nanyangensis]
MKLSIVAYGDPVLKKVCGPIEKDYPNLHELIENMWETMYNASGVGLAAPQIGLPIRLFVVDTGDNDDEPRYKKVFINAQILEESGEPWGFTEGCLSIPEIREEVFRKPNIVISYFDENWQKHEESVTGFAARVIQHEYDHIEGKLFTEKINLLRKQLIKGKLDKISKGEIRADYKMKFPRQPKKR